MYSLRSTAKIHKMEKPENLWIVGLLHVSLTEHWAAL